MSGFWILLLLTVIAVLPLIMVFFWFKARKLQITLPWFLIVIAAGIVSLFTAALIQNFLPQPEKNGLGALLFGVFIRVAVIEEAGRLLTLIPLIKTANRFYGRKAAFNAASIDTSSDASSAASSAAAGLVAGLGFAAIENAFYGMADINITLLRAFTAAPLHGACGIRIGAAIFEINRNPVKTISLFLSAVIIHGAYDLIIVSPAIPSLLAAAVAFLALFVSIRLLKTNNSCY